MIRPAFLAVVAGLAVSAAHAAPPIKDADTRAWWAITSSLSGDDMEGRDTGSPGHARAVKLVAARFAAAGLKPAGESGGWTQTLPLHEVKVEPEGTRISVEYGDLQFTLGFLSEVTVKASDTLPRKVSGRLVFRGYCGKDAVGEVAGKAVICFGARRQGLPSAAERTAAVAAGGGLAILNVDDPGFTIEPARWPEAYARTITLRDDLPPRGGPPQGPASRVAVMRLAAGALAEVIAGSGQDAAKLLRDGSAKAPLPNFDIPARLEATFAVSQRDLVSDNVLGLLPGTDPALKAQVVVVSAHLDGYGFGEPVAGDALYNGAFDDAAYVATLIRLAERRQGRGFKRSVLFAAFTGEEKGLLGATWFTRHPTVPKADLAADINLDQLRPLFPLKILTMHAVDDTTLGASAKALAAGMGIEVRPDREPERNLNQRADHWPFLRIGVPATGFVFGYEPGTEAERRYREWYQTRYHRPQDDLTQPWEPQAAADFNTFFYRLTERVANAAERPTFVAGSALGPK